MSQVMKIRTAPLIAMVFILATAAFSGTSGKIAGKVTDKSTGEPIVGANVTVRELKMGSVTNLNGEYFILKVPPGTYTVTVSMVGYEGLTTTHVEIIVDRTTTVNASIAATDIEGETVVVVAERPVIDKNLTASEQVVTSLTIEMAGFKSVNEALLTQPGIFVDNSMLAWQRGRTRGYVRGSSIVQAVYMLDNLSVNSGLVSDNYTGFNTSSIEQISILTGGYNAEYGEGRSEIVNIVSREASPGVHGTFLVRMRPAGVYHFGRNMYSWENNDYVSTGIDYWTAQSKDVNSRYYGLPPDSLLTAWRKQSTPNDTLARYAERPQLEYEGTILGGINENLSLLVSGRYKNGVGIFPQAIPYNPEYNFQGYVNYKITPELKIRVGGFLGGYESADYTATNMNTSEYGQESSWLAPMRIDEQYARAKFNLWGAPYRQWPEKREWSQLYGRVSQVLNDRSFYDFTVSYLKDRMDRSDRYGRIPLSVWLPDVVSMVPRYTLQAYYHTWTKQFSQSYQVKGDYTNQISQAHNVKAGFGLKAHDFSYENFAAASGGSRVNDANVFNGNPYEGNVYVQDKFETEGLVINLGLRMDFFNQNRSAPKNMYDPLAFQVGTPGHVPGEPDGIPGTPELQRTSTKYAFAPRIGISHPITENAVLHLVYGHFYQRPSWTKMFGFTFVNYTTDTTTMMDPYAKQTTYMDEWQGYYGNPDLGFERTIQYEVGVDYNIADILRLDVTGYYKDATREANVITGVYPATRTATKALIVSNSGYSDVRGIETKFSSRFDGAFNFGLSHEVYWSYSGEVGYSRLYEPGSPNINVPKGERQSQGAWADYQRIKGWASLAWGKEEYPVGLRWLSDFSVYSNVWWRQGDPYTYHAPGDPSTEPNNMRWFNYYQIDLRVAKGFDLMGVRAELSVEVKNLFNFQFLRLLEGDDLTRYMENPDAPDEVRLPKTVDFPEPNVWEWYSYEVPPRQFNFQVSITF
jgi:outer membrane receptor protein involved in Fe transport